MNKKKILIIIAVVAGLAILYFAYKGKAAAVTSTGGLQADSSLDAQTFEQLCAVMDAHNARAMDWLLPIVEDFYDGRRAIKSGDLIRGKPTLSGAFMSAYGTSYWPDDKNQDLYNNLQSVFTQFRAASMK